jgi:cytochrome c oxidase subunit IV
MSLNTDAAHAQAHDHEHHIHGGPKLYAAVLGGLLFLTVVTVGASMINFGGGMANVVIAMLIASIKASLVALFFMHLRWEGKMNAIIFCSTLFFLGLFLIGCYTDNVSRPPLEPTNLKAAPTAPPGQQGPRGGQQAPSAGQATPGAASPSGGGTPIPGASPQNSYGGAATGTAPKPETTH